MDDNSEILELKTRFEALEKINNRQKNDIKKQIRKCNKFQTKLMANCSKMILYTRCRKYSVISDVVEEFKLQLETMIRENEELKLQILQHEADLKRIGSTISRLKKDLKRIGVFGDRVENSN